ncbi:MAG: hypothetical protein L6Q26_13230 [Anaerolineales bacterium]|nr:hypothetical protein [Anaerolineales bacterium]NUQ85187.1 hypothetical protein [Anaerolineales bacterium]
MFDFRRVLTEIGAMDSAEPGNATEIYIVGRFEYNIVHEIAPGHDDELCLHPLFSGIFGNDKRERPVHPYGCGAEDEDDRDNFEWYGKPKSVREAMTVSVY